MTRLSILFALFVATSAGAAEPQHQDFAYEAPIGLEAKGSVFRVPLTLDVYRAVTRTDLGDMRVFNAAGEVVPHGLTRPPSKSATITEALPFFPVSVPASGAQDDVRLRVERGADGAIVSVHTTTARPGEKRIYLVDATRLKKPLAALEFDWDKVPDGFIATLRVESSPDLKAWSTVTQGTLAEFARGDDTLVQKRIAIAGHTPKYLRLSWVSEKPGAALTAVRAEVREAQAPERDWLASTGSPGAKPGEYRLFLDGQMPVDRVRVLLPANSVARVALLSRAKDGDPWTMRAEKTVFSLERAGGTIVDNELTVATVRGHNQWLLRLHRQEDGIAGAAPRLEFGWTPDQAVFLARGAGPFVLAFGLARAAPAPDFGVDELIRRSERDDQDRIDIGAAKLGTPVTLRGDAAREVAWYQPDWKRWLLWGVLIGGVALLGYIAFRLVRQLPRE
jgi:hypothetical protein